MQHFYVWYKTVNKSNVYSFVRSSCVQLCTVLYSCVQLCTAVYSCVQLCTAVYSCVQLCTVVYKSELQSSCAACPGQLQFLATADRHSACRADTVHVAIFSEAM
jgi:hypothetical protein